MNIWSGVSNSLLSEIKERCQKADIKAETVNINLERILINWIKFYLNPKTNKINVLIIYEKEAEIFLGLDFENIYAISKYNAYYSITDQYIEAMLGYQGYVGQDTIYTNIIKPLGIVYDEANNNRIFIKNNNYPNIKLSLGLSETGFSILETLMSPPWTRINQVRQFTTLRIENINISSEADALTILEKISNSLLFQLNIETDLPIYLAPRENQYHSINHFIIRDPSDEIQPVELNFPTHEYDTEPISLYWYANTATRMPILQYLAYYQVIEFYFLMFKNNDDTYEIDFLKATIKGCVQPEDIKSFFEEKSRLKFFRNYDKWKDITTKASPIREQGDIINDTAIRIYDIRCKIVHTKNLDSSNETKFILPFSKEAQKLGYDIELVKFIARKVLEHCSKPLTI